jgi:hypothetical protein
MIVFYGWGKDLKNVAYAGIEKCPHCKNWTHFSVCEQSSHATLYFVKVARWNKKRVFVCGTCSHGWEIDADKFDAFIRQTISLPSKENCAMMWHYFDRIASSAIDGAQAEGPAAVVPAVRNALAAAIETLDRTYQQDHVRYVAQRFVASLQDHTPPASEVAPLCNAAS